MSTNKKKQWIQHLNYNNLDSTNNQNYRGNLITIPPLRNITRMPSAAFGPSDLMVARHKADLAAAVAASVTRPNDRSRMLPSALMSSPQYTMEDRRASFLEQNYMLPSLVRASQAPQTPAMYLSSMLGRYNATTFPAVERKLIERQLIANTERDMFLRYQALAAIGNAATSTSVASIHNLVSSSKQQMQSSDSLLLPFKRAGAGIEIPPVRSLISSTSKCIPSTNIHKKSCHASNWENLSHDKFAHSIRLNNVNHPGLLRNQCEGSNFCNTSNFDVATSSKKRKAAFIENEYRTKNETFDATKYRKVVNEQSVPGQFCHLKHYGSVKLAIPQDSKSLSKLRCMIREHIEFFSATPSDVTSIKNGRIHPPVVGQVGIRCIHCKHQPPRLRAGRSMVFPTCLQNIHSSVKNWLHFHFEQCNYIPAEITIECTRLRHENARGCASKEYWAWAAGRLGIVNCKDGICYGREPGPLE